MPIPTAVTNRLRTAMDRLPRTIRDARWFMWPFFFVWFKGRHVKTAMDIKRLAPSMTPAEFRDVYRTIDNLGSSRETDTNPEALAFAMDVVDKSARTLLDVGCGRGYVLRALQSDRRFEEIRLFGMDVADRLDAGRASYVTGDVEALPFRDASVDVVFCFHTLEHMRNLDLAIAELKRVCRKQLVVIVPRQEPFFYTLDLHLQFFPTPDDLQRAVGPCEVRQFGSDLVAVVTGSALR
jgi:SAM-dependent methyltransferase